MTQATRTFTLTVTAPPASGTPTWFNTLAHGQWAQVGGSSLATIYDAAVANGDWGIVDGVVNGPPHGSNRDNMLASESGATVDPVTGEVYLVANGGHNDSYENSGYVLPLRDENPQWKLMSRWTPEHGPVLYRGTVSAVLANANTPTSVSAIGPIPCTVFQSTSVAPATGAFVKGIGSDPFSVTHMVKFTNGTAAGTYARIQEYSESGGTGTYYVSKESGLTALNVNPSVGNEFVVVQCYMDEDHDNNDPRTPSVYADGRPRAMHSTFHQHYANGRIWFSMQNSIASGQGQSALGIVSYDREYSRGREPVAHDPADIRPWKIHTAANPAVGGTVAGAVPFTSAPSMASIIFEPSQLDRSTGLVWHIMQGTNRNFWSVDTNQDGKCILYTFAGTPVNTGENKGMWSALIPNADPVTGGAVMVFGCKNTHNVGILYITRATASATPSAIPITVKAIKSTTGGDLMDWGAGVGLGFRDEWGAVYHPKSRSILAVKNDTTFFMGAGVVRKLAIAFDANNRIDVSQPWTWTSVTVNTGGSAPGQLPTGDKGQFTKWNLIENFDGSSDALILLNNDSSFPAYVCKLSQAV